MKDLDKYSVLPTDHMVNHIKDCTTTDEIVEILDGHDCSQITLSDYINYLLKVKNLKRPQVVKDAHLDATFGYQIFRGDRGCSRDKLLSLAFAMNCNLTETNRMLKLAGYRELYLKNKRDTVISFCIKSGKSLPETDYELYRFGQETISDD